MTETPEDEELPYRLLDQIGAIEIREYGPRLTAETRMNPGSGIEEGQDAAFERLANFIFARDRQDDATPIAMTVPVAMDPTDAGQVMRFFMPAAWSAVTLPQPSSPAISIGSLPAQQLAVLRFAGFADDALVAERVTALRTGLEASAWQPTGAPGFFGYDPPWTPPAERRNEVTLRVQRRA